MRHILRSVNHNIIYFLIQKSECGSNSRHQFLNQSPYLLGNGKLHSFPCYFPKQTSDGLIVAETFCTMQHIVAAAIWAAKVVL